MTEKIGIEMKLECPQCASTTRHQEVLIITPTKGQFTIPKGCRMCGYQGQRILISFKQLNVQLFDEEKESGLVLDASISKEVKEFISKIGDKNEN